MSKNIPDPTDPTGSEGSVQFFRWTYYNNRKWLGEYARQMWEHYEKLEERVKELEGTWRTKGVAKMEKRIKELETELKKYRNIDKI